MHLPNQYTQNVTHVHWLLYTQRNCPTHSHCTGSIPQLWSKTKFILESIFHCVVEPQ